MNKEIEEKNQKLILDYLKTKKNDNTKKSYGHDLKLFSEFVDKDLMGVDIFNVTDYFNSIEDKSPATFNRRLLSVVISTDFISKLDISLKIIQQTELKGKRLILKEKQNL